MTGRNHPASSVEFLSRLHDGEVPADEKAAFERHRQSCADCRSDADAFEASLAALRASDVVPTPADLSARILRKIRSQSPSRRPFAVMYGIDVRWAGLLVAGLIAVLLSAPLVLRNPSPAVAPRPPISATLVEPPAEPKALDEPPAAPMAQVNPASAPAPAPPARPVQGARAEKPATDEKSAALEAPADDEKRKFAPVPAAAEVVVTGEAPLIDQGAPAIRSKTATRSRAAADSLGGEAGALADVASSARPPVHLIITALDDAGEAPVIVDGPDASRFAELRGREYVLTVEASGRIRSIEPSATGGFVAAPNAKSRAAAPAVTAAVPLQELRFAPGDRPRRLAVRVE